MSKEIKLVNSKKTATCDDCCFEYLNQFKWSLMNDGRAARMQPREDDPTHPHLLFLSDEIIDRHICDYENSLEDTDEWSL